VAAESSLKITDIKLLIWSALSGQKLGTIKTSAMGHPSTLIILPRGFWTYAPTESTACRYMARQVLAYLADDIRPAQ
jgi:hypothetical protein